MNRYREWGYVQARLQARHASLGDAAAWRALEASGSVAHVLQTARNGPLRPWVQALAPGQEIHRLEGHLRHLLRDHIAEVARWTPPPWRAAVRWCAWLPELPALAHLLAGAPAPAWMPQDPLLHPLVGATPEHRQQALAEAVELAPLLGPARQGMALTEAWWRHWLSLCPRPPAFAPALREALAEAGRAGGAGLDRVARRRLAERLAHAFRRHAFGPEAIFLHLARTALTLERLRGLLARRALFPPTEAA